MRFFLSVAVRASVRDEGGSSEGLCGMEVCVRVVGCVDGAVPVDESRSEYRVGGGAKVAVWASPEKKMRTCGHADVINVCAAESSRHTWWCECEQGPHRAQWFE
jgi:hypothetical protein